MKNIEKGTTKYMIVLIVTTALVSIILYPLFDLMLCKFITNSEFNYSINDHIIHPIIFSCIFGVTIWFISNKKNSK